MDKTWDTEDWNDINAKIKVIINKIGRDNNNYNIQSFEKLKAGIEELTNDNIITIFIYHIAKGKQYLVFLGKEKLGLFTDDIERDERFNRIKLNIYDYTSF